VRIVLLIACKSSSMNLYLMWNKTQSHTKEFQEGSFLSFYFKYDEPRNILYKTDRFFFNEMDFHKVYRENIFKFDTIHSLKHSIPRTIIHDINL
jgi:hypothetical protein